MFKRFEKKYDCFLLYSNRLRYICERLMHKHRNKMTEQDLTATKKANYRIAQLVDDIPSGRLTEEKERLAEELGISIPQLNRIIRGASDPSGTQLRIIADFFGVPVDALYERTPQPLEAAAA